MPEEWPDWRISADTAGELARYVDVSYTRSWIPADCRGPWTAPAEGADRVRRLYEAVRGHRIGYADEQWNPGRHGDRGQVAYQRIRGPEETMQGPATCLDLALVFAGMASLAGLRAFIGLRTDARPHALVVIDTTAPLTSAEHARPPAFTERPGDPGVWDPAITADAAFGRMAESDGWLVVDVVSAAVGPADGEGAPFGRAAGRTVARQVNHPAAWWTLVEVDRVLSRPERRPYTPPAVFPPIHAYLPALSSFTAYRSRQDVQVELTGMLGERRASVVVLQAPPGYGKSMLAHHLALGADNGCGWFLDATDPKALTASLARAERREEQAGEPADGEKPDAGSDSAYALAALERLRGARLPWVVVLDNCDMAPETPRLAELMPVPHRAGQVVIITTTHEGWLDAAARHGWQARRLNALADDDLGGLPPGVRAAVAGKPLIERALSALLDRGAKLPEPPGPDGPALVWDLARELPGLHPDVVRTARALAWCPPEPLDLNRVLEAAGSDPAAGEALLDLRLVAPSDSGDGIAVGMHRLFARAIREQAWRDDPAAAASTIERLMTSDAGQRFFTEAAEETALARLEHGTDRDEPGDAARAAAALADRSRGGLIWYGLGHIRERRGPVSASLAPFRAATETLDRAAYPFEAAESLIGLVRGTYQDGGATNEELEASRPGTEAARRLLEPLTDVRARQLREQGNALAWLIRRRIAGREPDPARRSALLAEVRDHLWRSYEERRRIERPDHAGRPGSAPVAADGLGAERAYFNLAGVYVELAKTHHDLARAAGEDERRGLLTRAAADLTQAATIYRDVRALREARYHGRAHPHLAACVHGEAIVAYHRAALLRDVARLPDALTLAGTALEQRNRVVSGLRGPTPAVLRDGDVKKSADLMLKAAAAAVAGRYDDLDDGIAAVRKILDQAVSELRDMPREEDLARGAGSPARTGIFTVREGTGTQVPEADPVTAVRAGPPRRRLLHGRCPDHVRVGSPFGLLVSVVLAGEGSWLKSFPVPEDGADVTVVIHAPGLTVRGDHMATVRVPAAEDSEPVMFELEAGQPGPSRVSVTAWHAGNYLGQLALEVTAYREATSSRTWDRSADLSTETVDDAVSLVVCYEPRHNLYRFQFHGADNPRVEPYQLSFEPGPWVENLVNELERMAYGGAGYSRAETAAYLADAGTELWRNLLPEKLRQRLWERRDRISRLTILADNDKVPWELLYPNDPGHRAAGFLVEQFPVVRDVFERPGLERSLNLRPPRFVRPDGSPPAADAEIGFLSELLGAGPADQAVISQPGALRELISRGDFGLLHFACHNSFSVDRGPSISFGDRSFTTTSMGTARADESLRSSAPLVFINACRSAGLAATYNRLDGWAEAFLQAGAGAFIGSLWAVGDKAARRFAELFYQQLLEGATLGAATLAARRAVAERAGDPAWLAYAVYGDPSATVVAPPAGPPGPAAG
jgi:hypothetical protein